MKIISHTDIMIKLVKEGRKKGLNLHKLSFTHGNDAIMIYLKSLFN
jgi:hypothetical protein